jgi:GTP-binding protein HflX
VLGEVGALGVPVLDVINKCDRLAPDERRALAAARPEAALVSARSGAGVEDLVTRVARTLDMDAERVSLSLDNGSDADRRLIADLYRHARVVSHEMHDGRVAIEADVPKRLLARLSNGTVLR